LSNIINDANEWRDKMRRFLKIPAVVAISLILLNGSPAFATQIARQDVHHDSSEQEAGVSHPRFGSCGMGEGCAPRGRNATHDDWPANMILG
jgi:hypothetical protein